MSSDRQRSDDESPSTSSGSSDADQRDPPAPEPEEQEERKPSATQQKKNTKLSSKTTAKLSTSAKRIQKELAEITLDPPPNCRSPFNGAVKEKEFCLHGMRIAFIVRRVAVRRITSGIFKERAEDLFGRDGRHSAEPDGEREAWHKHLVDPRSTEMPICRVYIKVSKGKEEHKEASSKIYHHDMFHFILLIAVFIP
ncbi:ubiquitin-conjugating enzyme E2 E3 isoform X2 [Anomalospiza imberbis]|uniref:ubiquitin-conjugating enzyme E2 E3 isoform X2 n=1 Tax=Anomalospiza imberbis TaxID=187417 RepID=UPI00358FE063